MLLTTTPNSLPHWEKQFLEHSRSAMTAKCLALLNWTHILVWLRFPLDCGLCHQTMDLPCWPRICLPSTPVNWEELMDCNFWIWTAQRSLHQSRKQLEHQPRKTYLAGRGNVGASLSSSSSIEGAQSPRSRVFYLGHIPYFLVSPKEFAETKPLLHCESPQFLTTL